MGLSIDGNVVHGIAKAGNAFLPSDQAGMLNLVGSNVDFTKVKNQGDRTIRLFQFLRTDPIAKGQLWNAFIASDNFADSWNMVATIRAETVIPVGAISDKNNPNYRQEPELFLGFYFADDTKESDQWTMVPANVKQTAPILVWLKYTDIKDLIVKE